MRPRPVHVPCQRDDVFEIGQHTRNQEQVAGLDCCDSSFRTIGIDRKHGAFLTFLDALNARAIGESVRLQTTGHCDHVVDGRLPARLVDRWAIDRAGYADLWTNRRHEDDVPGLQATVAGRVTLE